MDALQEKAIRVIKPLIPPDAEDRVFRIVRQLNKPIRDHIRAETGLRLSDDQARSSIPVKVTEGFPTGLAGLIGKYDDPVLWRLIAAQPRLGGIIEGLQFLLSDWGAFEKWPALPPVARDSQPSMERARDVALALQQVTLSEQVKNELKAIHEDILGAYRFTIGQGSARLAPWVEIYWMPIALIAAMLDVSIEDLTVVTLGGGGAGPILHERCNRQDGESLTWWVPRLCSAPGTPEWPVSCPRELAKGLAKSTGRDGQVRHALGPKQWRCQI